MSDVDSRLAALLRAQVQKTPTIIRRDDVLVLQVGKSTITLLPDRIIIDSPRIDLNPDR